VSAARTLSSEPAVTAVLVGSYDTECILLREVFGRAGWRLLEASGLRNAISCVRQNTVHVVIASAAPARWNWRRLLERLRGLKRPPLLIVTSRTADDSLWAEVLNVGGYDVLAEPFDRDEVERVVAAARRHFDPPVARVMGADPAPAVA
jgi:DNA-binding response OmpR family regulator